ncbi:MAG: hypothetical protein ACXABY_20160 [Candidatus Thorarchaeota archaeon]|jgi:hypothetical protein
MKFHLFKLTDEGFAHERMLEAKGKRQCLQAIKDNPPIEGEYMVAHEVGTVALAVETVKKVTLKEV